MKKLFVFMLITALLGLCACGTAPAAPAETAAAETPAPTESAPAETAALRVGPLESWIDLDALGDCTLSAALDDGGIREEDGKPVMELTVYDYERFDMVDVSMLEAGSVIAARGEELTVGSIERTDSGAVIINGGYESGGLELVSDGDGVFYSVGADDAKDWYELGTVTLPVSGDFVFTDSSELASPGRTMTLGELAGSDIAGLHLGPNNTTAVLTGGEVVGLEKVYTP